MNVIIQVALIGFHELLRLPRCTSAGMAITTTEVANPIFATFTLFCEPRNQ
jgi:hypothetical protein